MWSLVLFVLAQGNRSCGVVWVVLLGFSGVCLVVLLGFKGIGMFVCLFFLVPVEQSEDLSAK